EDSDDAISNDEGDKNQNSNIFGDDDDAKDGREHQVNEDPIEEGEVGQVTGYKMEGCMKNMAEIIETQGVDEVFR
nr:hypothetical protein [Tanacetum cinerariifolium]